MNAATKTRIANVLTALVAIFAVVQTSLTNPPLQPDTIVIAGGVLAFLSLTFTALKQWLSADVNSSGVKVTIWILGATVLTGLASLLNIFHLSDVWQHYITWGISVAIAILNILSKQIFPSGFQQDKQQELKTINPVKTTTKN